MENVKKYRFLEALDKIVGTDKKIKSQHSDEFYTRYTEDGKLINDNGGELAWPSIVDQKAQIWEIEPEPIYVWGVCDGDGKSFIYTKKPVRHSLFWGLADEDNEGKLMGLPEKGLFFSDKAQKFKLVPVED